MNQQDRLYHLYGEWVHHIKTTPSHTLPTTKGGSATFDTNLATTYITCYACNWEYQLEDEAGS